MIRPSKSRKYLVVAKRNLELVFNDLFVTLQWAPPPPPEKVQNADEQIAIDLGDEYEQALTDASQEEIIDLAGDSPTLILRPLDLL